MRLMIIVLILLNMSCKESGGGSKNFTSPSDGQDKAVFLFGDINATGYGQIVADYLQLPLVNLSKSGTDVMISDYVCGGQLDGFLNTDIERLGPQSIVLFMPGYNDVFIYREAAPNQMMGCLRKFRTLVYLTGARMYIAMSPQWHANRPNNLGATDLHYQTAVTMFNDTVAIELIGATIVNLSINRSDAYYDSNYEWLSPLAQSIIANDFLLMIK